MHNSKLDLDLQLLNLTNNSDLVSFIDPISYFLYSHVSTATKIRKNILQTKFEFSIHLGGKKMFHNIFYFEI